MSETYQYRTEYWEPVWGRWVGMTKWGTEDDARESLAPDAVQDMPTRTVRRCIGPEEVAEP